MKSKKPIKQKPALTAEGLKEFLQHTGQESARWADRDSSSIDLGTVHMLVADAVGNLLEKLGHGKLAQVAWAHARKQGDKG